MPRDLWIYPAFPTYILDDAIYITVKGKKTFPSSFMDIASAGYLIAPAK